MLLRSFHVSTHAQQGDRRKIGALTVGVKSGAWLGVTGRMVPMMHDAASDSRNVMAAAIFWENAALCSTRHRPIRLVLCT